MLLVCVVVPFLSLSVLSRCDAVGFSHCVACAINFHELKERERERERVVAVILKRV